MDKENRKNMKERYDSEMLPGMFHPITVKDLDCSDCDYAFDEVQLVSVCEQFTNMKPGKVLYGKKCDKHSRHD